MKSKELGTEADIQFWELAIRLLKEEHGANCVNSDLDDFPELVKKPSARCSSCRAKEAIVFLEEHIAMLKMSL